MKPSDLVIRARALLPAMVDDVEALVAVESPTDDLGACEAVVQAALDASRAWLPSPARLEVHNGRPAWRWGPEHPDTLLLGHLDTVWPVGSLARLPFACEGDRMTGPGVFDMKAGVVQGWAALHLCGLTDVDGVGMLLTTDEETGSLSSRHLISDAVTAASRVLVLEPSVDGALKTARKGTSWYSVDVEGRAAHAGLEPERGINALVAAAEFVTAAPNWADGAAGTTVTPTMLQAGTTPNTVPALARVRLDVRAWTAGEQVRVDEAVRAWRPSTPGATVFIHGGIDRPAMEESSSTGLFAAAQASARGLGLAPLEGRAVGGASDGNLTSAAGVATLDGLGAVGAGAHADDEWASVAAMAERAALLAALIAGARPDPTA